MNTAARLEQACRTTGHALLASKPLLDRTLMPAGIVVTSIGSHLLRGKAERLELFALERGTRGRADRHHSVASGFAERDAADASCFSGGSGGHAEAPSRLHRKMLPTS
jgi:hypothetical protein